MNLSVHLGKLTLPNPVTVASGTFGYGVEYAQLLDLNQLGAVTVKGIRLHPVRGNPTPRTAEVTSGMLNAIGLQGPGVDGFIAKYWPFLSTLKVPTIINIWGTTVEEYAEVARRFDALGGVGAQALRNEDFARGALLVDRLHAPGAVLQFAIDAERARARLVENLDDAPAVGGLLGPGFSVEFDAHQHARPEARRGRGSAFDLGAAHQNARRFAGFAPIGGTREQFAVRSARDDFGDDHRRQPALADEGLAAARDRTIRLEVLDEQLQFVPGFAFDAEGARDLALADAAGRLLAARRGLAGNEGDEFVTRGRGGCALGFGARGFGAHGFCAGDAPGFHAL